MRRLGLALVCLGLIVGDILGDMGYMTEVDSNRWAAANTVFLTVFLVDLVFERVFKGWN